VNIPPRFSRKDLHHRRRKDHESRVATEMFYGSLEIERIDNLGLVMVWEHLGDGKG